MWALVTLCFSLASCDGRADPKILMVFYTKESCHDYGKAVVEDSGFVYFCADASDTIVED